MLSWLFTGPTPEQEDDSVSEESVDQDESLLTSTHDFCLESHYNDMSTWREVDQMLREHVLSGLPYVPTVPTQHVLSIAHLPTCDPYPLFRRLARAGTIIWQRHETDSPDLMDHLTRWGQGGALSRNQTPVVLCLSYRSGQENRAQPFLHRALEAAAKHSRLPHWLVLVANGDQAFSGIGIDRDTMARAKAHILLPTPEETQRLVMAWLMLTEASYAAIATTTRRLSHKDEPLIQSPPDMLEFPAHSRDTKSQLAARLRQDFVCRLYVWREEIIAACVNHGWLQVQAWLTGLLHGCTTHDWSTWLAFANDVLHDGDGDQLRRIGDQKVSTQFRRYYNYTQRRYTEPPQPIEGTESKGEEEGEDTEEMAQWPPKRARPGARFKIPENPFKQQESKGGSEQESDHDLLVPSHGLTEPTCEPGPSKRQKKKRSSRRK